MRSVNPDFGAPPIAEYFAFDHLQPALQMVSAEFFDLFWFLHSALPESAERSAGFRKLLEAKDCFVRARMTQLRQEAAARPSSEGEIG